jgi:DNA-directed RNA polymerase subunit RPC12/RpoP
MTPPPGAEFGPLTLLLSCPKCGAPFETDDETVSTRCAHCGSRLLLAAPDRAEVYLADGVVGGPADVLDVVISYRLEAARAEILGELREAGAEGAPFWLDARLSAIERDLRATLRLAEVSRFLAPYWHLSGRIVQAVLGRTRDGPKDVHLRAYTVEHTVPAYDTAEADLRDRGLRLSRARVRPLVAALAAELRAFLPWRDVPEQAYREIDRFKGQDLERSFEAVARHGRFLEAARTLVYRPYWLARLSEGGTTSRILVDGQFGTIAGHPDADECRRLAAMAVADPLGTGSAAYRRVVITASRCPQCGFEGDLRRGAHVVVCVNCHRALKPEAQGARVVPYDHARPADEGSRLDGDYVPFWRYDIAVDQGGRTLRCLEDYAGAAFPGSPPVLEARGPHLWVPAFRLLGTEPGDEALRRLAEWLHAHPPVCEGGTIPLGGTLQAWDVTLPEPEARDLLGFVLLGMHGRRAAARMNARSWKAAAEARLEGTSPRLVMVPCDRDGATLRLAGGGPAIPLLLLEGGPELEVLRASVHRAHAAPPDFPRLSY